MITITPRSQTKNNAYWRKMTNSKLLLVLVLVLELFQSSNAKAYSKGHKIFVVFYFIMSLSSSSSQVLKLTELNIHNCLNHEIWMSRNEVVLHSSIRMYKYCADESKCPQGYKKNVFLLVGNSYIPTFHVTYLTTRLKCILIHFTYFSLRWQEVFFFFTFLNSQN